MRAVLSSSFAVLAVVASAACGASQSGHDRGPIVIRVGAEHSMDDVAREAYAAAGGGRDCLLVWGDVVTQPADATRVRVMWADFEHIDGWVLCGDDAELVLLDPRARSVAILYYRDGRLLVGHPTDGGTAPLRRTTLALRSDGPAPALSVFDANSSDANVPAFRVLRELREVDRDFLIAAVPVVPRAEDAELAGK